MFMLTLILLLLLVVGSGCAAAKKLLAAKRGTGGSIGLAVVINTFVPAVLLVAFVFLVVVSST